MSVPCCGTNGSCCCFRPGVPFRRSAVSAGHGQPSAPFHGHSPAAGRARAHARRQRGACFDSFVPSTGAEAICSPSTLAFASICSPRTLLLHVALLRLGVGAHSRGVLLAQTFPEELGAGSFLQLVHCRLVAVFGKRARVRARRDAARCQDERRNDSN